MQSPVAPVVFTYVAFASAPTTLTPLDYDIPSKPSSHVATNSKMVRIPDFFIFHVNSTKNTILYRDWHLQMRNKLQANKAHMLTKTLKKSYMQNRVADNTLAQLSTCLKKEATQLFASAKKMFEILTAAFGDTNRKQEACIEYRLLHQRMQDFNTFWAHFQQLTAELDHSEEIFIDNLIEKCHHSIQRHLVDEDKDLINLLQLAKCCQKIKQGLKKVNHSQLVQNRIAERNNTRRNNESTRTIVNTPAASAAPLANLTAMILHLV